MSFFKGSPIAFFSNVSSLRIALSVILLSGNAWSAEDRAENESAGDAGAEDGIGEGGPGARSVVLMIAESSQEKAFLPLITAVRGQLSDFPVEFRIKWVDEFPGELPAQEELSVTISKESGASMVFWCDLTRSERMYLYLAIPSLGRVVVRRFDGSGSGGTPETLGIILRNLVDAVLKGAVDDLRPELLEDEPPPEPAPAPPEEPPVRENPKEADPTLSPPVGLSHSVDKPLPAPKNRLYTQLAYALDVLSTDYPATHGISLLADVFIKDDWHVFLGYVFAIPIQARRRDFEMELSRHPALVGARYGKILGRVELGGGMACVVDYVGERIRYVEGQVDARPEGGEVIVSVLPFFQLSARLVYSLQIYLKLGFDVPLNRPNYVIESGVDGIRTEVFSSWPVRPVGRFGLMMGFF